MMSEAQSMDRHVDDRIDRLMRLPLIADGLHMGDVTAEDGAAILRDAIELGYRAAPRIVTEVIEDVASAEGVDVRVLMMCISLARLDKRLSRGPGAPPKTLMGWLDEAGLVARRGSRMVERCPSSNWPVEQSPLSPARGRA